MSTLNHMTLSTQFTTDTLNCIHPGHESYNHFHLEPHIQYGPVDHVDMTPELKDGIEHHESMLRQIDYDLYKNATIKEVTYRVVWRKVVNTTTNTETYVPAVLENHFEVWDTHVGPREFSCTTEIEASA